MSGERPEPGSIGQTSSKAGPLPAGRTVFLTAIAMIAFAGNSILCRVALADHHIDPGSFTLIRLASGAITLAALTAWVRRSKGIGGSWAGGAALLTYAATFSYAYTHLHAGTGAFLLFAAVQATMVMAGLIRGERLSPLQWLGLVVALAGLGLLASPGAAAPPIVSSALMLLSGMAWGLYSLLGCRAADPLVATAGNFLRALPLAIILLPFVIGVSHPDPTGIIAAVLSGALTSGIGYAIWYAALPGLSPAQGASVQLSVPVIAAFAGAVILSEPLTLRLGLAALAILGGIALVISARGSARR